VAAGSAALGALAGVALLELTSRARKLEVEPVVEAQSAPAASVIVGWLAPSARPKPRSRPASSARERAQARADAGARARPVPDAGVPEDASTGAK
jgi:hypothetical protein